VSSAEVPDLLFNVRGRNIRFGDIVGYASYLASKAHMLKAPIPVEKIPTMTFHHVEGYASLSDMQIGRTRYPAGLGLQVETEIFKQKFGLKVDLSNDFKLSGFGYMPRVDVRIKGRDIFKLYNSAQPDRGPQAAFDFDPKNPLMGYFSLRGALEIPALRLKQDVRFSWSGWFLDADFETAVAGISLMLGVRINTKPSEPVELPKTATEEEGEEEPREEGMEAEEKEAPDRFRGLPARFAEIKEMEPSWRNMMIRFAFKDDFAQYMTKTAIPLLTKMKDAASRRLKTAMATILSLKAKGARGFEAEIERARRSVERTEEKLRKAKETCTQARWYKKYLCAKVAAQQTILAAKKSYLNGLLRPTKAVATKASELTAAAAKKMVVVQEFALETALMGLQMVKAGFSLFKIKEVVGQYTAHDIATFKLPLITTFVAEIYLFEGPMVIRLDNIQFDFAHPYNTVQDITMKLLKAGLGKQMEYIEIVAPRSAR
jgi:hypothetical protein